MDIFRSNVRLGSDTMEINVTLSKTSYPRMFLNHKGCAQVILKHPISSEGVQNHIHCGNSLEPAHSTLTIAVSLTPAVLSFSQIIRIVALFCRFCLFCGELNDPILSPHKIERI